MKIPRTPWGRSVEELVPASSFDLLYEALSFYATTNNYTAEGVLMNGVASVTTHQDQGSFAQGILSNPAIVAAKKSNR